MTEDEDAEGAEGDDGDQDVVEDEEEASEPQHALRSNTPFPDPSQYLYPHSSLPHLRSAPFHLTPFFCPLHKLPPLKYSSCILPPFLLVRFVTL